jgi:hypothetical protein
LEVYKEIDLLVETIKRRLAETQAFFAFILFSDSENFYLNDFLYLNLKKKTMLLGKSKVLKSENQKA